LGVAQVAVDTMQIGHGIGDPSQWVFGTIDAAAIVRDDLQLVVVADGQARQLAAFQLTDGRPVWSSGGRGRGPGQYETLRHVEVFGDTVLAWDRILDRATLLDAATGRVLGTSSIAGPRGSSFVRFLSSDAALFADRLTAASAPENLPLGVRVDSVHYYWVSIQSDTTAHLGKFEEGPREYVESAGFRRFAWGVFSATAIVFPIASGIGRASTDSRSVLVRTGEGSFETHYRTLPLDRFEATRDLLQAQRRTLQDSVTIVPSRIDIRDANGMSLAGPMEDGFRDAIEDLPTADSTLAFDVLVASRSALAVRIPPLLTRPIQAWLWVTARPSDDRMLNLGEDERLLSVDGRSALVRVTDPLGVHSLKVLTRR